MGVVVIQSLHRSFIPTLIVFSMLLFFFSSAASLHGFSEEGLGHGKKETARSGQILDQKRLGGPRSEPPNCRLKCETCEPCRAVYVSIPPHLITPLEYYPEAWFCKCGGKLFVP